jgi:uncharacterized protein (DUF1684 family)
MPSRCLRVAAFAAAISVAGCSSGPPPPDDSAYRERLAAARAEKDQFFRTDPETPVPAGKRDALLPLRYFPIDPAFTVPAALRLADKRPVFEMPTSSGTLRKYQHVGSLEFTFSGHQMSLGAFVEDGTQQIDTLFVPFADLTTGSETYSAGRYLELTPTSSGVYTIDFNLAYNPYCAYNASYECPFPPSSNRLKAPIRAGEKVPGA